MGYIFISMHPLLWVNAMLDVICMGSVELRGTRIKWKLQNENHCLQCDSNPQPSHPEVNVLSITPHDLIGSV